MGYFVLIFIIFLLILCIMKLFNTIKEKDITYNTLENDYKDWKEEFEYTKRELERCKIQIDILEKEEENRIPKKKNLYKGKRVIVGDYDKFSSQNTKEVLNSFGIKVDIVRSGKDIIDRIKHGYKYDAIFTNNVYKNFSGLETLNQLRKIENFHTPIIIHTITQNARHEFVDEDGFDEYIEKPLNIEKVTPILKKFFDKKKR